MEREELLINIDRYLKWTEYNKDDKILVADQLLRQSKIHIQRLSKREKIEKGSPEDSIDLKQACKIFKKIKKETFILLEKTGLITFPIDKDDYKVIAYLNELWGKKNFGILVLRGFDPIQRKHILRASSLNKIGAYIYSRYVGSKYKVRTKQIASELKEFYKVKVTPETVRYINKIRKLVYNDRVSEGKRASNTS